MISDITLIESVVTFLNDNKNDDIINDVFAYAPPSGSATPYCIVGITDSGQDRIEQDRGNDETINLIIQVLTEHYGTEAEKQARSITQLYYAVDEVRRLISTTDYLDHVKRSFTPTLNTLRVDDYSRTYGIVNVGGHDMFSCTITTPFIAFNQVQTI